MTDEEILFRYRLGEAQETLGDAERMLQSGFSHRSVINIAYYAMFYAVLALFIRFGISQKTSKHSGVISIFDREFIHTGKLDKNYSKILHRLFEARQECDYKELVELTLDVAANSVKQAPLPSIADKSRSAPCPTAIHPPGANLTSGKLK